MKFAVSGMSAAGKGSVVPSEGTGRPCGRVLAPGPHPLRFISIALHDGTFSFILLLKYTSMYK